MNPPVVVVFCGTDPTGGAGIAADVLTLASFGCHAAPVVTAVTAQDSTGIKQFTTVEPELVVAQVRAVVEDMPVAAFKAGMLGNAAIITAIAAVLDEHPKLPFVLDPVQASNRGDALADEALAEPLRALLIPRATLITPNSLEARTLALEADTLDACAQELMSLGAQHVLLTGTHEPDAEITHRFYGGMRLLDTHRCERLPHDYHGSGCTLAAACAAALAHGLTPAVAVREALRFTYETLRHGYRPGQDQYLPNRLFWATQDSGPKRFP